MKNLRYLVLGWAIAGAGIAQEGDGLIGEVLLFDETDITIEAATKSPIPISESPASVTLISAQQIRESGARTIPELLRMVAGVNVRWNPMMQTVDIRGFGQNPFTSRVLLLIDGVPYNSWNKGGFPQQPGLDFFVLQNVKRIEVVRGPGSSLYGENAYWGVINIVSLDGEDLQGGSVEAYAGDLETSSVGLKWGDTVGEHSSILLSAKVSNSQIPTSLWFEDNDAETEALDVFLKYKYKALELSYYRHSDEFDGYSELVPIPAFPPGSAFTSADKIEQDVDIFAAKFDWDTPGGDYSFGGDLSYAQRDGAHCAACHAFPEDVEFHTSDDHGSQLIADLNVGIRRWKNHDVLVGFEARNIDAGGHIEELVDVATLDVPAETEYSKFALYLQDRITLNDEWTLVLGGRYDGSTDLFDSEFSPRAAAVWRAGDGLVFRGSYSTAFRFPNFSELYQDSWFFNISNGQGFQIPLAVFLPNPVLEREKITTFELGMDYRINESLTVKADLFRSQVEDFIVIATPEIPMGPGGLIFENHPADATILGTDLEFRWTFANGVAGFANYGWRDFDSDGNGVDSSGRGLEFVYAPENSVRLGTYFGPFGGFRGSLELQWADDFETPDFWAGITGVRGADANTYVNARFSYEFDLNRDRVLKLSLYGRNLLDETGIETLTGVGDNVFGRAFYGSAELRF